MKGLNNIREMSVLPGIEVACRLKVVDIRKIPEIAEIVNAGRDLWPASDGTILPLRTLFMTENSDGTFAVLNDLTPITPELSRSTERNIFAAIVKFDPENQYKESVLRNFLSYLEPARFSLPIRKFLKELFKGSFDDLAIIFGADREDLRFHSAWHPLFPKGVLAKATFYRIKLKSLIGSGKNKPAEEKAAETKVPKVEPEKSDEPDKPDEDMSSDAPPPLYDKSEPHKSNRSSDMDKDADLRSMDDPQGNLFDE